MTDIRTNPVGTKEQREELLRQWPYLSEQDDVVIAFRGLDIAQEMRNAYVISAVEVDCDCTSCEAARKWDEWKGELVKTLGKAQGGHFDWVVSARFNRDGHRLITGTVTAST